MKIFEKLFGKREEHISLDEAREIFSGIYKEEDTNIAELKTAIGELEQAVKKLENAKLMNENLYPKERALMEGNRKSYLHYAEILIKRLKHSHNSQQVAEAVAVFSRATMRSYNILLEFFEEEVQDVARALKEINDIAMGSRNLPQMRMQELKKLFDELDELEKNKENTEKEKRRKLNDIKKLKAEIKVLKKEVGALYKSHEFEKYKQIEEKAEHLKEQIKEKEYIIYHAFFQFSKYLKKMNNFFEDNFLKELIGNPVTAFNRNTKKAFDFLSKLKEMIEKNKITVKTNQREKILKRLDNIDRKWLEKTMEEINELKNRMQKLEKEMQSMDILSRIEHKEFEIRTIENRLREIHLPKESDYDNERRVLVKRIQSKLSKLTGRKLLIDTQGGS